MGNHKRQAARRAGRKSRAPAEAMKQAAPQGVERDGRLKQNSAYSHMSTPYQPVYLFPLPNDGFLCVGFELILKITYTICTEVQECVVSKYGGRSSMAERFTVDEDVEGSSPFGHPT